MEATGATPRFAVCPTQYCSNMATPDVDTSSYIATVGRRLLPQVRLVHMGARVARAVVPDPRRVCRCQATVFWTGPSVVSQEITEAHVRQVSAAFQRPVLLWDNLHANDYDNGRRLFLGPFS